ncbi:MAG: hypothetical protein C3F15_13810 [Holophagae bacterium]|nr:MAG: hypothetical protein C3F15_13810 [Holophagae bacterium]
MKHVAIAFVAAALLASGPVAAQVVSDDTILTYEVIKSDHKALAMEALAITPEQLKALSPVYDAYLAEVDALDAQLVDLIKRFNSSYKSLDNATAEQMITEIFTIQQEQLDLRKHYNRQFHEVLPAHKVLRLWQIENKLGTIIAAQLVRDIPLAK